MMKTVAKKATTKTVATKKTASMMTGKELKNAKRYSLIRSTGTVRRGAATRAEARMLKQKGEKIWDAAKSAFIR